MPTCPSCKGKGKYDVHSTTSSAAGNHTQVINMTCFTCDGSGKVSAKKLADLKAEKKLWCYCGNPSGTTTYHPDGSSSVCHKHHWTCNDCGKVTQVG